MVGNVSLNASMRTNLLSLQQISKLQDQTQLRLATGLKVNSAIDNPSSYYTATSLSNRANDLSLLLDAMGQGVQTIQAANEGLETAGELLSQMKAVVEQANTGSTAQVPEKEYFIKEVGENGAVVSTAEELRQAITDGKETICVYGNIDLGDISATGGLQLQENQKLVGVNYFGDFKDGMQFSSISATDSVANHAMIEIKQAGCLVSDLSINYENSVVNGNAFAVRIHSLVNSSTLCNLNVDVKFNDDKSNDKIRVAIFNDENSFVKIGGEININAVGHGTCGIMNLKAKTEIDTNAIINIKTKGYRGDGIASVNSEFDIKSGAIIDVYTEEEVSHGIISLNNGTINIHSDVVLNVKTSGENSYAMFATTNSSINVYSNTELNIETLGDFGYGIVVNKGSFFNVYSNSKFDIHTYGIQTHGIYTIENSVTNIYSDAYIKILTEEKSSHAILTFNKSEINISCNLYLHTKGNGYGIVNASTSGNTTNILSSAQIYFNVSGNELYNARNTGNGNNILKIAQGAKLAFEKNSAIKWYEVDEEKKLENTSTSINEEIKADNVMTMLNASEISAWKTAAEIIAEEKKNEEKETLNTEALSYQNQFNNILSQYDALINDSSYKGVNLLKEGSLKINFNEDKSSNLLISGVNVTSENLGLKAAEWKTQGDVQTTLDKIQEAKEKLRAAASELGNYYSIITTREDFTNRLINVLEEGSDKLTLADMNEESANMLSLQTQQLLAINSLSLSSQASQSILRLF